MSGFFDRRLKIVIVAGGLFGLFAAPLAAQDYPNRTVRLVVPFAPGGGTNSTARIAAEALAPRLGAPVVVGTRLGRPARSVSISSQRLQPTATRCPGRRPTDCRSCRRSEPSLAYRCRTISSLSRPLENTRSLLRVNPKLPFTTLQELIAFGKANPGKLRYSSAGTGGGSHLAAVLIRQRRRHRMDAYPLSRLGAGRNRCGRWSRRSGAGGAGVGQAAERCGGAASPGFDGRRASPAVPGHPDVDRGGASRRRGTL